MTKAIATAVNISSFGLIPKKSVSGLLNNLTGGGNDDAGSSPTPLPQPPSPEAAADKAADAIRKKKAAVTQSVYTSPLGVQGEAQVARKTLLGQ